MGRRSKKSRCATPDSGASEPGAEPPLLTVERVAAALGVAANYVEMLRLTRCEADTDFCDVDGAALLTEAGAEKIRAIVDEGMRATAPDVLMMPLVRSVATDAPRPAPQREDLRLTRVFRWSANILAELPNGREVVLTVRSNRHLQTGMVLRGCIKGDLGWTYEGRLPRSIGERQLYFPPAPAALK